MLKKLLILLLILAGALGLLLATAGSSRYSVDSSRQIAAAPEQVWSTLAAINHWPDWWPGVERANLQAPLQQGTAVDLKLKGLPEAEPVIITEVQPERLLAWQGQGVLGSRVNTRLSLQKVDQGCRVALANRIEGPQAVLAKWSGGDNFSRYQALVLQALETQTTGRTVHPDGEMN